MNEQLVKLHDGELSDTEAALVAKSLAVHPDAFSTLRQIKRIDQAVKELDRQLAPDAATVEAGKAALKASLVGASGDDAKPGPAWSRRRVLAVMAGVGSMAAMLAIGWSLLQPEPVALVRYAADRTGWLLEPEAEVRLGEWVHAMPGRLIWVQIPSVGDIRLLDGGPIRLEDAGREVRLSRGSLRVTAEVGMRVQISDGACTVEMGADASATVIAKGDAVTVWQSRGEVVVRSADSVRRLEPGERVTVSLIGSEVHR